MGFNYAKERTKFDREWDKLRREYEAAGMIPATIEEMYQYDLQMAAKVKTAPYIKSSPHSPCLLMKRICSVDMAG